MIEATICINVDYDKSLLIGKGNYKNNIFRSTFSKQLTVLSYLLFITISSLAQTNTFPATGNVGVGTTNPQGNVQIVGQSGWDQSTKLYLTNGATDYGRTNLIITGRMQSGNDSWIFGSGARNSIVFAENAATSGQNTGAIGTEQYSIQLEGNSNSLGFLSSSNSSSPNMVLLQNGNIGIGTINPTQKLEVGSASLTSANYININSYGGSEQQQGINFNAYYGGAVTTSYINNDFFGSYAISSGAAGHGMNFLSGRYSPCDNYWFRNANGNVVAALVDVNYYATNMMGSITATHQFLIGGAVGIGTTNPGSFKLAVEGNIGARKVVVTKTSPFPDYVFNDEYKLPSLTEIEQFIKVNKHLPEIPSAKEVERNGLDIGDNQTLLLKKVEELTLYLIAQNKKTEKLEKENKEGLKEIKALNNIVLQQQKEIELLKAKK